MRIEINKFDTYNGRKDVKTTSWFRLENDFASDPDIHSCDNDTKMVFIVALGEASKRRSAVIELVPNIVSAVLNISVSKVIEAVKSLDKTGKVTIVDSKVTRTRTLRARNADVTCTNTSTIGQLDEYVAPQTDEPDRRTRQTRTNVTWDVTDEYAKIFSQLLAIPQYAKVFDTEKDRATLKEHAEKYGLTVSDLEQVSYELKHWADGREMKSPRGQLATFVRNYAERRDAAKRVAPKPKAVVYGQPKIFKD